MLFVKTVFLGWNDILIDLGTNGLLSFSPQESPISKEESEYSNFQIQQVFNAVVFVFTFKLSAISYICKQTYTNQRRNK